MTNTRTRRPKFHLKFVTEDSKFHVVYDAKYPDNNYMTESVISVTTKNAMEDDSSAFSVLLSGDVEWHKLLNENDLMILHIDPYEIVTKEQVEDFNNTLIVGLISEVRIEGEYTEDSKMYRITGQSFQKAFMQFNLRTIRQANMAMTQVGWMDYAKDSTEGEAGGFTSNLVGRSISDVILIMLDRFTKYMQYNFNGKKSKDNKLMRERLVYAISSWNKHTGWKEDEERLLNPLTYTSYEGSFNQLLKDITTPPFCEMFFDTITEDGVEKSEFVVRRTPFNRADWKALPRHTVLARDVITESIARNDLESYSIFNVIPETGNKEDSGLTQAVPYFNEELVYKYGYSLLEFEHKFLTLDAGTQNTGTREDGDRRDIANADDPGDDRTLEEANALRESSLTASYSRRLYNWYANNPNFYSGDITVLGHPRFRLGNRLLYKNEDESEIWEFYIESVEHTYSYSEGYRTTLGVTRGVLLESENDDGIRFNPPMGGPKLFTGGFMGELSLADIHELNEEERRKNRERAQRLANRGSSSDSGSGDGAGSYMEHTDANVRKLFQVGEKYLGKPYVFGGSNPSTSFDCSGLIYWVYKEAGLKNWSRMDARGQYNHARKISRSEAKPGDLVFFSNTYKRGISHVGIYAGGGRMLHTAKPKGVHYASMDTNYWRSKKPEFGRI